MRKIITLLSAIGLFSTSSLSVVACGTGNGKEITVNINEAPTQATNNQDPLKDYVYNDTYNYNSAEVSYVMAVSAQLMVDYIKDNKASLTSDASYGTIWTQLFNSDAWINGNFSTFNYGQKDAKTEGFTFHDSKGNDYFYNVKNNDASVDSNRLRIYWFKTDNDITVPSFNDIKTNGKNGELTKNGNINLIITIADFSISFNIKLDFDFSVSTYNNSMPLVILDSNTFNKPLGNVTFDNPKASFDRISVITINNSN